MPLKFWDHAFLIATYLINRLPTPVLANKSPFFLLHLQFPDYKFLKSFGCTCFSFLRPYNSHKFDFHSKECVFLGYSNNHKGYKCLDASGRTFISKDVVFNEVKFPYPDLFPSQKVCSVLPDGPTLSTFLRTPGSITFTVNSPTTENSHSNFVPTTPIANTPKTPSISSHHSDSSHRNNVVLNPTPITILSPSPSQNSSPESSASVTSSQSTNYESLPPVSHKIHPQNHHSMRTRGKHEIVQPRINPSF